MATAGCPHAHQDLGLQEHCRLQMEPRAPQLSWGKAAGGQDRVGPLGVLTQAPLMELPPQGRAGHGLSHQAVKLRRSEDLRACAGKVPLTPELRVIGVFLGHLWRRCCWPGGWGAERACDLPQWENRRGCGSWRGLKAGGLRDPRGQGGGQLGRRRCAEERSGAFPPGAQAQEAACG